MKAPTGNSRNAAHRRLKKHRPDLFQRVFDGELSAHRAMVMAGFRTPPTAVHAAKLAFKRLSLEDRMEFWVWISYRKKAISEKR